jgi:hypothetical protein
MSAPGQEFEFAAVRSGSAGSGRAKDTCGPKLPFGSAIDLANARAKAVIGARRNIPPAMDGRSVPLSDILAYGC